MFQTFVSVLRDEWFVENMNENIIFSGIERGVNIALKVRFIKGTAKLQSRGFVQPLTNKKLPNRKDSGALAKNSRIRTKGKS